MNQHIYIQQYYVLNNYMLIGLITYMLTSLCYVSKKKRHAYTCCIVSYSLVSKSSMVLVCKLISYMNQSVRMNHQIRANSTHFSFDFINCGISLIVVATN